MWFLAFVYPSIGMTMMSMFPVGSVALALVWGLVEVLGAVAGAWLYQEQGTAAAARV